MGLRPFKAFPKKSFGPGYGDNPFYDASKDPKYMNMGSLVLSQQNAPSVADTIRDESIKPDWFQNWLSENSGKMGDNKDEGFGWNMDTMNILGKGLGGIGNLARGWAAIKNLGIAKDQLDENKRQYNQNYAQQLRAFEADRTRANTRISDQNAWKTAQGRTDLGSLIA